MSPSPLQQFIAARPFGFMDSKELETLVALAPLQLVLCRFGGCRLLCPAQNAAKIIKALEASGDYIRDVSIRSEDLAPAREACGFGDHTGPACAECSKPIDKGEGYQFARDKYYHPSCYAAYLIRAQRQERFSGHCRDCGTAYASHICGCEFCPSCWLSCPRCGGHRKDGRA